MSKTTKSTRSTRNGSAKAARGTVTAAQAVTEESAAPVALEIIEEEAPDVRMFRPGQVIPWPGLNPRTDAGDPQAEEEQAELDASIREHGVRTPALVHLRDELPHWLVQGSRRLLACEHTGRMLPAVVGTFTEEQAFELALVENIQRANLTPIQEARGFRRWLEQHPEDGTEYTLAAKMGKSQPYVSHRLSLLRLPEGAQRLVAERLVTATQARDAFLPFASIPEEVRAPLFDAVELRVREQRAANPDERPNLTTLKAYFGAAAIPLSKPLSVGAAGAGEEAPLFDPKDHAKKCGCNGPTWLYRNWGTPQARCFNAEWWNRKQDAARKAAERDEEKRRAEAKRNQEEAQRRADEAKANGGEPSTPPVPVQDARTLYPTAITLTDSASDFRRMGLLVDPTLIPAESLRIVEGWEPFRAAHSLICTDRESLQAATEAGRAARLELIRRLTEERNAQEREEAGKLDLRAPEVLADLLAALPHATEGALARIADQHDLTVPPQSIRREHWLALPKRDLQLFARVVVLRVRAGTLNSYKDPVEAEAERQLLDAYSAKLDELRALVSFPRPAFVEQMDALAERFYAAHGPLAAQVEAGDQLSESAGEAIHELEGIVARMRALYDEADAAGADVAPLNFEDVRTRLGALVVAYEAQHGAPASEGAPQEGAPAPQGHTDGDEAAVSEAPAAPQEREGEPSGEPATQPQATADELAARRRGGKQAGAGELVAS